MAVGRIFTREQIDAMDNGQTGAGSVFTAAGGYRCRHHWRAVRPDWFDDDEWAELTTGDVDQADTQPDGEEPSGDQVEPPATQPAPQAGAVIEAEPVDQRSEGARRREATVRDWRKPARLPQLGEAGLVEFGQRGQNFTETPVDFDQAELATDKADLRRIYQDTQNRLVEAGTNSVEVFRPVDEDNLFEVEGVLTEWSTTKPESGDFITETIDARRVAFDDQTTGWDGPSGGVAILRERPNLRFEADDFDLPGGLAATEVDPAAERAGTWGIILEQGRANRVPRGQLVHLPTGEAVLSGAFTREDLRVAARDLDRFTDADGLLPTSGAIRELFDEETALTRRYVQEGRVGLSGTVTQLVGEKGKERLVPTDHGITAEEFIDLGGVSFPVVNTGGIRKKAASSAAAVHKTTGEPIIRWGRAGSKNTTGKVLVERDSGSFEMVEIKGHVRGNFFIYSSETGHNASNGNPIMRWHLVHLATGVELHSGSSFLIEGADGVPDIGGWRMEEMGNAAAGLETFLDPDTGAVKTGQQDAWLQRVASLERETAPGVDVADILGERFRDEDWTNNPITRRARPRYDALAFDEGDSFLDAWNSSDVDLAELESKLEARQGTVEPTDDLSDIPF